MFPTLSGFVSALIISLMFVSAAGAVTVSPSRYRLAIDPGKEQIVSMKITNTNAVATTFRVRVGGAKQDPAGHTVFGDGLDKAEQWLLPRETKVLLKSNEEKKVFFTVAVPPGTEPGTHTAALFVEEVAKTALSAQVATLLMIDVAGVVHEAANITTWTIPAVIFEPELATDITIKNNGTVAIPVKGSVNITPIFGKKNISREFSLGNTILPGSTRKTSFWHGSLSLFPGPYKAKIHIRYGLTETVISAEKTFWYIPRWFMGPGIVLVLVVAGRVLRKKA